MSSCRAVRIALCAVSLLVLDMASIPPALATSGWAISFTQRYPSSTTRTAAGCSNTCHGGLTSNYSIRLDLNIGHRRTGWA